MLLLSLRSSRPSLPLTEIFCEVDNDLSLIYDFRGQLVASFEHVVEVFLRRRCIGIDRCRGSGLRGG